MHYGVYGQLSNLVVKALGDGLVDQDHRVTYQRVEVWNPWDSRKDFDRVVVMGLRGKYSVAWKHHEAEGTPVIIREAPHFRDVDRMGETFPYNVRQQRLSLGQHSWLPSFPCPSDRFDALGLGIDVDAGGDYVLVCGQTILDTQHGLNAEKLSAWLSAAGHLVGKIYDLPLRWRPHPRQADLSASGMEQASDPADDSLADDLAGAGAVVTYNSTVGVSAARLGIPVYIGGKATYSELANVLDPAIELWRGQLSEEVMSGVIDPGAAAWRTPESNDVRSVMARIAYTQWTQEEIKTGAWIETMEASVAGVDPGWAEEATVSDAAEPPEEVEVGAPRTEATPPVLAQPAEPAEPQGQLDGSPVAIAAQGMTGDFTARDIEQSVPGRVSRGKVRRELDAMVEAGALSLVAQGAKGPSNPRTWRAS